MLSLLSQRELGNDNPLTLQKAERTRRSAVVELSKYQDFEAYHKAGINTLNLDVIDDRYLLSGAADGTVAIHDLHVSTGIPQGTYPKVAAVGKSHKHGHKYSVETVQWYPLDTGMFVSSGMDKFLKVWDTNSMKVADEYVFQGAVYSHDMSPIASHCLIAAGSQSSRVKLIDIKSGSATHTLRGHTHSVLAVKWSPKDEFLLVSGSEDNCVFLWDIRSAKASLMKLDQHNGDTFAESNAAHTAHNGHVNSVLFTSDGMHIVSFGTDEKLRLWDAQTGQNTLTNYGKISNESRKGVQMAVTENCNPEFLYVPEDADITIFNLWTGERMGSLNGHYNQVNCVLHNNQNQELYSGGNDRNMLVWRPDTEQLQAWEAELRGDRQDEKKGSFTSRVGTGDAWSDDDD